MIELSGITKRYGAVTALEDVSLTIHQGEVIAIAGENGSGKSTLMKVLSGVVVPDSGQISIGHDNVVNATYQIASSDDIERDAYIVTEKTPSDGLTHKLTCINYTDKYYQNDTDFKNGLIS